MSEQRATALRRLSGALAMVAIVACGSGGRETSGPAVSSSPVECDGSCASSASFLTTADVESVLARAIAEAQARAARATIAVVDRSGNVLAVYRMNGAAATVVVESGNGARGGLEQVNIIPAALAAIAKAVTGAYLSSEGNAFSTRTASQIVQSHFNPGELLAPSGPLFGVQFSQLPCSDVMSRFLGGAPGPGPKRSPLGLSADPGGFPLYKAGTPVGGVGVIADGRYSLDANVLDRDSDLDEAIALAASFGLAAPDDRRADRITADGKILRFSDIEFAALASTPASAPTFSTLAPTIGSLTAVPGYFAGTVVPGVAFAQTASGVRADGLDFPSLDAFVLVDAAGTERFRPRAGTEVSGALTASESRELLASALQVANRSRAQIRRPLGSRARVTISVVDSNGVVLGIVRSRDAPMFGIDVSVQKARAAAFFSGTQVASTLAGLPAAVYLDGGLAVLRTVPLGNYVMDMRSFTGLPALFGTQSIAFTGRAVGNLSRPFYPDGVDGNPHGPLAKPAGQWSPFSTGLQLDLAYNALVQHVAFVLGAAPDVSTNCSGVSGFDTGFASSGASSLLANGIQIFPGSVPIYRGRQLIGAIGVSGDGIDQDDMIAYLGVADAARRLGSIAHAPADLRADQQTPQGSRLRYVSCPQAPFLDSNEQEPCRDR